MVDEESIVYLAVTAMAALVLMITSTGYGPFAIPVLILALLGLVAIIMINYVDFLIFPAFTKAFKITIVPANKYTLSRDQDAVVKYVNGVYYATGYLTGNIFEYVFTSQQAVSDESGLAGAVDKWERIVMNIDFPFKFNVIAMPENVQKFRDELEGERGYIEFQISHEMNATTPNTMTLEDLQRQMQLIQERMDRITGGERPLNVIMYIESTAVGVSEKEALDALSVQLGQLQTVFNSFDLNIFRISGREVYYLHGFNYRIPNERELFKVFQLQK